MTAIVARSPAPTQTIARTLASRTSWPRATVSVAMPTVSPRSSSVAMSHRLLDERFVPRHELEAVELPDERREPEPAERDRRDDVEPVESVRAGDAGNDEPVVVDEPHDEDQDGDRSERHRIPLHGARQQQEERHE